MTEVIATEPEARTPAVVCVSTEGGIRAESDVIEQNKKPEEPRPDIISPPPILRCIPRLQYPIRRGDDGAWPFPLEAQMKCVNWTHPLFEPPKCEWREEPSLDILEGMIRPTLRMLGFDIGDFDIEPLATGAHNEVYTLTVVACVDCGLAKDYVIQVAMPLDPYYKIECEVSITELVLHFTRIPVPIICTYDSSAKNELGLEWMLMEKISGQPHVKRWLDLHRSDHMRIARQVADWQEQLSKITSNQLGGLYLQWTATELQFFIGCCVEASFYEDRHILYHFPRGPFRDINEFYDSMVTNQMLTYNDNAILLLEDLEDFGTPAELLPMLEALRPKCQEILSRAVHPDDTENKDGNGPPLRPELQSALEALRHPIEGGTMHTRLAHEDVSLNNIMIDANINFVALLDREHASLLPNILIEKHPAFLLNQNDSEQWPGPQPDQVPVDDVEVGAWRKDNHESLRKIQARLRPIHKHRLEELDSTLPDHLNEEDDPFESDLHNWCCQVTPNPKELMEWVEVQLQETPESSDDEAFESFRSVPLPQHPFQVSETGPQSLCLQAQYQSMEWTPHGKHGAQAEWRVEPSLALLEKTVQSALSLLSVYGDYKVEWLPSGDFNSGYSVEATEENTAQSAHLIFRIPAIDCDSAYLRRLSYGFNCYPFKPTFDPYDTTLQHTLEEAGDTLSKPLNSTYLEDEGKIAVDDLQQEFRALISTEMHKDDIEKWLGNRAHRVEIMQGTSRVERLRVALPAFRPPGAGLAFESYLQHRDIRVGNIVMGSPGNITALLDWEHVVLKPVLLHDLWPLMIHGRHGVDCSELNSQTIGHRGSPPGAQEWRIVLELLEDVIGKNLRKGYRQHLQELESPLVIYRKDLREQDMRLLAWLSGPPHYSDLVSKIQPGTSSGHKADNQEPVQIPKLSVVQLCEEAPHQSDIFRSIPKPQYPIRVCQEGPHSMRPEMRKHWLKTTYQLFGPPGEEWRKTPSTESVRETVAPVLERLGYDSTAFDVKFLARGGFNQVFGLTATSNEFGTSREFVFRVPLPINPYYKTECEVATTEIARHFANIPVPIIYAYDSSTNNSIGLEWILMEKLEGESLMDRLLLRDIPDDALSQITSHVAEWQHGLAQLNSTRIGGVYMRWTATDLEFFLGPTVDIAFSRDRRLSYECPRGPFESINEFYDALLHLLQLELHDPVFLLLGNAESMHPDQQMEIKAMMPRKEQILCAELHEDDRKNIEKCGPQIYWNEKTLPAVNKLRDSLSTINPPESSDDTTTMLTHIDLAARNIMVRPDGSVAGVIDWEHIYLQPVVCMKEQPLPEMLDGEDEEEDDSETIRLMSWYGEDEMEQKHFWDDMQVAQIKMILTHLRPIYRKRLEELESPLLKLFEEYDAFAISLRNYVFCPSKNAEGLLGWLEFLLDESTRGDEDKDEESDGETVSGAESTDGGGDECIEGDAMDWVKVEIGKEDED